MTNTNLPAWMVDYKRPLWMHGMTFPHLDGEPVRQGHVDYCKVHGHATHKVHGVEQPNCPRCGASIS